MNMVFFVAEIKNRSISKDESAHLTIIRTYSSGRVNVLQFQKYRYALKCNSVAAILYKMKRLRQSIATCIANLEKKISSK